MRQEDAEELQKKILSAEFNFNDFLKQTQMISKMGSFSRLIGMIPGMNKVSIWTSGPHVIPYFGIVLWKQLFIIYSSYKLHIIIIFMTNLAALT